MDIEDIRKKKIIETSVDLQGDIADVLPEETLRKICSRWIPEISELKTDGSLFLEHGYEASSILEFLASELAWGTENNSLDIRNIPEQRKWNLLYTLESMSLCHASNILTWSISKDGVKPQLKTTPWRTGPEKNWYDYDIEPVDSYNLNEKLDRFKVPVYPRYMDEPSRYYNHKDPATVGIVMGDSLCRSSGLTERISIFNDHLPVRPFNDSGIGKWGGIPTFATPFESDTPTLSASPLISKIDYPDEKIKTAASMFISKKQEIDDIYGYMMTSLAAYTDEQMSPEKEIPVFYKDDREVTPERCRRFAAFFRFAEMDMWKNFDYIMKTYRIQNESQYSIGAVNKEMSDSFARIDISDSPPKTGQQLMDINRREESVSKNESDPAYFPEYTESIPEREPKETHEYNVAYDAFTASAIWKKFNKRKKAMIRAIAVRTLADIRRQYEDMTAEIAAVEECTAQGSFSDFKNIREEKGLLLNSRIPTQRFFSVEAFVPVKPSEIAVTFNEDAVGQAALQMIKDGKEKSKELVKSAFSKKEQEDHLRGVGTALHSLICMAVDAVEGRSMLKDWSADIYSTIQEHSINDAMLPRDRESKEFREMLRKHGKLAEMISPVDFSKIREGVKLSRYGMDIGGPDSDITTFGEWSQLEQFTPSPGFRPFVERADGLSLRELIKHGIYGTPLQNGLTRDNSRYVLAPRITKWRLRSSLKDIAKTIRDETAGTGKDLLTAHADDPSRLPLAREGILEFVLSFCDAFAKEAHKTKMDLFNDAKTAEALACSDKPESRLSLMKAASESWMLGGTGLYQREKKSIPDDRAMFEKISEYMGFENDFDKYHVKTSYSDLIEMLSVMSYTKEYTNMPRMIRLGILDREKYYERLYLLNPRYKRRISLLQYQLRQLEDYESYIFGNMIKDNSQYIPLLKVLEYPKDPFSGTYNYNLNLENRDLMHTDSYIKLFSNKGTGRTSGSCFRYNPSDIQRLPMGLEKRHEFYQSADHHYNIALDNMMRLAWHGNSALIAARTFRDVLSRGVMGYEMMYHLKDGKFYPEKNKIEGDPEYASNGRMGTLLVTRKAQPFFPDNPKYEKVHRPALFIKSALPEEENYELIDSYTMSEYTPEIYRDKNRILNYSALNPRYLFMTLFQPMRRLNNSILIENTEIFPKYNSFGYGSFGYDRRTTTENVSDEYRYRIKNYIAENDYTYHGEIPMIPSALLVEAALKQVRERGDLRREYDSLKEYVFAKECIIARSGNNREERNWESARMRCLIQDIGYTVRQMREKNADLPLTVMSSAAMDPLSRLGEPEIRMAAVSESVKKAELSSILRKAYWGADFHNIRKHLNINNTRFYEDEETPGGCIRKLSARYAYQYEFLKNIDFLQERYRQADNMISDPNLRWIYRDILHQNCASLTVKRNMRDYIKDREFEPHKGFDATNLLRATAFAKGHPLDNENRKRAKLICPSSLEYPRYKYGMEYYRNNITKNEFTGWTDNQYRPDGYFISSYQDSFINSKEDTGNMYDREGVMFSSSNIYWQPDNLYGKVEVKVVLKVGEDYKELSMSDYSNIRKDNITQWIKERWIRKIYTENKLDPAMNGEIMKENVPFLAGVMESDLMSKMFEHSAERALQRRDYYPSSEEMSVIKKSFESGLKGFCRSVGIEVGYEDTISVMKDNFTDEPPCWFDGEGR